ncbi:MAG TPA: hypothetical protein VIF62_14010 [Labilithrix sp.]
MRKVVPLFVLLVVGLLVAGGRFAAIPTAAASPASRLASFAPVTFAAFDPAPPTVDLPAPPSAPSVAPAKRKANATTKHRGVYRCETRPLQMGTIDTTVEVCAWREG